jgi:hypothetical protein
MHSAFSSIALKTGSSRSGELEMTRSTSEVAVCCSSASASCFRASASSRVRVPTCSCRSARVELAGRAAVGALLRLGFVVLPCCAFAGLRPIVRRRLTEPSHGATTVDYHIKMPVVQHSKIDHRLSARGQNENSPFLSLCQLPPAADIPSRKATGAFTKSVCCKSLPDFRFGAGFRTPGWRDCPHAHRPAFEKRPSTKSRRER